MALVIQVSVFDPQEAAQHGRPYELKWNLAGCSVEQFDAAAKLLAVLSAKMDQQVVLRQSSHESSGPDFEQTGEP
jgi:YD repeat-containing protein